MFASLASCLLDDPGTGEIGEPNTQGKKGEAQKDTLEFGLTVFTRIFVGASLKSSRSRISEPGTTPALFVQFGFLQFHEKAGFQSKKQGKR